MALTGKEQVQILPQTVVGYPAPAVQITTTGSIAALASTGGTITNPTITGGTIDGTVIGGTTAAAATMTTLTATSTVTLSPASKNVVLSPTGTGVVTINPATAGTMNNVSIGATTALAGKFTTATVTTNNGLLLTSQTSDAGAEVGTLLNAPIAGDPAFWLRISVNGTNVAIPAWTAV